MPWDRNEMAARAALELEDGFYVNLGIGIPTLVSNYVPTDYDITLQSENGMLGMGPFPTEEEIELLTSDDPEEDRSDEFYEAIADHMCNLTDSVLYNTSFGTNQDNNVKEK